jgi:hypothetical protein
VQFSVSPRHLMASGRSGMLAITLASMSIVPKRARSRQETCRLVGSRPRILLHGISELVLADAAARKWSRNPGPWTGRIRPYVYPSLCQRVPPINGRKL